MIIHSESSQSDWLGWTGAESTWPCGFQALREAHVYGELRDAAGITQQLTQGTHYKVALGVDGTVTASPLPGMVATHGQVRFHRLTPALKDVEFINLSSYSAAIHDYYYAADAMRDSELRRDIASGEAGGVDVTADEVSYPGGGVGLGTAVNVREALDLLAARGLAHLPDTNMTLGPAVDQYRVVYNHSSGKFVLAPQTGQSGAEIVAAINVELGGTTWQTGGTGGGGGGTITGGSNVGSGGALGVFKAVSGVQLQFNGVRGVNGIIAQLNAPTNSIDFSFDTTFGDGRYVKAAQLDDVAFTGAYSSLSGLPTLGSLSAKNVIGFVDIVATAIANLAEAQAGTAVDKLMTPQRVRDAILAQALASSRQIIAGAGLGGGGALSADVTLNVVGPATVSGSSTNAVTGGGHSHALAINSADIVPVGNAIGSYALMKVVTGGGLSIAFGGNVAGGNLRPASFDPVGGTAFQAAFVPTGTWRNMGGTVETPGLSLFARVS
jgi:hypothetical protein